MILREKDLLCVGFVHSILVSLGYNYYDRAGGKECCNGMAYEQIYIYFIWQIKKPKIML